MVVRKAHLKTYKKFEGKSQKKTYFVNTSQEKADIAFKLRRKKTLKIKGSFSL